MKLESSPAWQRLVSSRLVPPGQLAALKSRIDAEQIDFSTPEVFFDWLQQGRLITPFQAWVLESDDSCPLVYGDYAISSRINDGPLQGQYIGYHRASGHPLLLEFFRSPPGKNGDDLWQVLDSRCRRAATARSPFIVQIYEPVALPEYAFVVSELPSGTLLAEKVPRKARLPWKAAVTLIAQIGSGAQAFHAAGLVHGSLNPRAVWVQGKLRPQVKFPLTDDPGLQLERNLNPPAALARSVSEGSFKERLFIDPSSNESLLDYLAPEVYAGAEPTPAADLYSLGCLLVRVLTGRVISGEETFEGKVKFLQNPRLPDLSRYELPKELQELTRHMVDREPTARPESVKELIEACGRHVALDPSEDADVAESETKARYLRHLAAKAAFFAPQLTIVPVAINVADSKPATTEGKPKPTITDIQRYQQEVRQQRHRSQLVRGVAWTLGSLAMFGLVLFLVSRADIERPPPTAVTQIAATKSVTASGETATTTDESSGGERVEPPPLGAVLYQFVRKDDGVALWESPTTGPRMAFEYLPQNARMVFTVRLADLARNPQGRLAMTALAPELQQTIQAWLAAAGLEETDVRQVVIGLYPLDDAAYSPLSVLSLGGDVPLARLRELWRAVELQSGSRILKSGEQCYLPILSPRDPSKVEGFVMGPQSLVEQAVEFQGINSLDGSFKSLSPRVDASRHFNAMILPSAFFNQQGQSLVGSLWADVQRFARTLVPNELRGLLFSLHFDGEQAYWELTLDHTVDAKPPAMVESVKKAFAQTLANVDAVAAESPSDPYWNRVRVRLNNIVDGCLRTSRFGAEAGLVVVNNWVPNTAPHNLLKAADLALRFRKDQPLVAIAVERPVTPRTMAELLQQRRSLSVTTNPDLNILLKNLETEINEAYTDLPFPFRIQISGNDLLLEGITQNQRPGDFELANQTLAQILTEIVFRANPDKEATGPEDPRCKLVWVIRESAGQPEVVITTRTGAQQAGLDLPAPFRERKLP